MASFSVISPTEPGGLPLPGICKSCGSSTKEKYLDTGTQENDYGAILFCFECVNHFASLFDFLNPEKVGELRRMAETQYLQNLALNDRVDKLTGAIDDLVRAGYNGGIDFVELDLVHLGEVATPTPRETAELVESGESATVESDSSEGPDSLPSTGKQFSLFN